MKYLYLYESYISNDLSTEVFDKHVCNEKKIEYSTPNWFYLVIRANGAFIKNDDSKPWESLSRMKFDGLRGISDNILISRTWFDVRPIMLVMSADDVLKVNEVEKIEYFNPDQLVANNLEKLIRICDNERGDHEYGITSTITKLFQNISSITNNNVIGSKKKSRINGTWTRDVSHKHIRMLMRSMNNPSFYYGFGKFIYDKIKNDNLLINSISDLSNMMGRFIEENRIKFMKNNYGISSELSDLVKYYDKYRTISFGKIISWAVGVTGKIYNRREGEWIIKKGTNFKVPDNSYLFIKETPSREDAQKYSEWQNDLNRHGDSNESRGFTSDQIKEYISDYNLDKMYTIQTVKHSHEMLDILKNKFSN